MEIINLKEKGSQIPNLCQYEVVAKMNNHTFTLVRVKDRILDFHTHMDSDEVFFIVDGQMKIEFRDKTVDLKKRRIVRCTKRHRTPADLYYGSYVPAYSAGGNFNP